MIIPSFFAKVSLHETDFKGGIQLSQQSEFIHQAPPPHDDNSLFVVYAPADMQDWLHKIMDWKKINPIDVSDLDTYQSISSRIDKVDGLVKRKPDGIIYYCNGWWNAHENTLARLRNSFPNTAMAVILEQDYYIASAQRSLRAMGCLPIHKSKIGCKADIIYLFDKARKPKLPQ